MRIDEVETQTTAADPNALLGLVKFLSGRAEDTNARKSIDRDTFVQAAQSLGINVTSQNLGDVVSQEPLTGVLEPLNPDSPDQIFFKGAAIGPAKMSVPQAQQVVSKMAKSAMKRAK